MRRQLPLGHSIVYRRQTVAPFSPESFALKHLSSGIQCLSEGGEWLTTYVTDNASSILGVPSEALLETPNLWINRVHPNDVDAVRAALRSVQQSVEMNISYRFRDSKDRYRWIGFRCKRNIDDLIIGVLHDITRHRSLEYSDRIHLAVSNSLSIILDSSNLSTSIMGFLEIFATAIVVDRSRLIRFRNDGRTFITHEWRSTLDSYLDELPKPISSEVAQWWKEKLAKDGVVAITTCDDIHLPDSIKSEFKNWIVGSLIALPVVINNELEGFVSFESDQDRAWLPIEIDEAKAIIVGHTRSVERRIEDRRLAAQEYEIRLSEEKYRVLTANSPVILFGIDSAGIFTLSEGVGLESMGAEAGGVVGHSVYEIYRNYPDILEHVNKALQGTETNGIAHIGSKCFEMWFTPVFDEDKVVEGLSGVAVDITPRFELEQQQKIMMRELDHRVKNNIASVISLVGLSKQGSNSLEEFAKTLDGRLHALNVAHSALAKSHWSGVSLKDILLLTLQPYLVGSNESIRMECPDVELPGVLSRPMCMVIHELATNAVKHGSLSVENGSVLVQTELLNRGEVIKLIWSETDGPPVAQKQSSGIGTSLLEGLVAHEMNGTINTEFHESGVVCQIEVPITQAD
ncbi:MAG: HWE histidine kinase domain-containing protein [Planctomycetota bacterium]|nr:HWE histidine kinase domain-containing protein [Planctomycetota bacterium]